MEPIDVAAASRWSSRPASFCAPPSPQSPYSVPFGTRSYSASNRYASHPSTPLRASFGADGSNVVVSTDVTSAVTRRSNASHLYRTPEPLTPPKEDYDALSVKVAHLSARCEELERLRLSLQRENERWRQEVDEMRSAKLALEQQLSAAETRLALARPSTPVGFDEPSICGMGTFTADALDVSGGGGVLVSVTEEEEQVAYADQNTETLSTDAKQLSDTPPLEDGTITSVTEQLRRDLQRTMEQLIEEKRRRGELEQAKANIEAQLEDLSRTVFEEAQKMVADERLARIEAERKRDAYATRVQELEESEKTLKSQIEELRERVASVMASDAAHRQELEQLRQYYYLQHQQYQQQLEASGLILNAEDAKQDGNTAAGTMSSLAEGTNGHVSEATQGTGGNETTETKQTSPNGPNTSSRTETTDTSSIELLKRALTSSTTTTLSQGVPAFDPVLPLLTFNTASLPYAEFCSFYKQCMDEAAVVNAAYSRNLNGQELAAAVALVSEPVSTTNSRFLRHVHQDDVEPCIRFSNAGYFTQRKIITHVQEGTLLLDPLSPIEARQLLAYHRTPQIAPAPTKGGMMRLQCTLCEWQCSPDAVYRLYLGNERRHRNEPGASTSAQQRLVCQDCRLRLIAACEFWTYVRQLRRGMIRIPQEQVYLDILRHRLRMFLARVCTRGAKTITINGVGMPSTNTATVQTSSTYAASIAGASLSSTSVNSDASLPPSPQVKPVKPSLGGGSAPDLAETSNSQRSQWRNSVLSAMDGARRSWATLSQLTL